MRLVNIIEERDINSHLTTLLHWQHQMWRKKISQVMYSVGVLNPTGLNIHHTHIYVPPCKNPACFLCVFIVIFPLPFLFPRVSSQLFSDFVMMTFQFYKLSCRFFKLLLWVSQKDFGFWLLSPVSWRSSHLSSANGCIWWVEAWCGHKMTRATTN